MYDDSQDPWTEQLRMRKTYFDHCEILSNFDRYSKILSSVLWTWVLMSHQNHSSLSYIHKTICTKIIFCLLVILQIFSSDDIQSTIHSRTRLTKMHRNYLYDLGDLYSHIKTSRTNYVICTRGRSSNSLPQNWIIYFVIVVICEVLSF